MSSYAVEVVYIGGIKYEQGILNKIKHNLEGFMDIRAKHSRMDFIKTSINLL